MATQDQQGTAFHVQAEDQQQRFRLLELPPELLTLIESDPRSSLQLKSTEGPPGQEMSSTAVLCTADKTFNIRQVNTSNIVYITQPCDAGEPNRMAQNLSSPGILAMAQCDSTLEVLSATEVSAAPFLKSVLPVYTSTGHRDTGRQLSKQTLFDNIPASQGECDKAWVELTCFELGDGDCFVPSAAQRHNTWRAMITQATADGWNIEKDHEDDIGLLPEQAPDQPVELSSAITSAIKQDGVSPGYSVDKGKCLRFVGRTLLEALSQGAHDQHVTTADFVKQWRSELPEKWSGDANVDLLRGWCTTAGGGKRIAFAQSHGPSSTFKDGVATAEGKSALGAKRKWHDKFRHSKKAC